MAGHLLAVVVMQGALLLLARVLACPLRKSVVAAGLLLPHLLLAPWFVQDRIMLPTVVVERNLPGAPRLDSDSRHINLNDTVFQLVPWEAEARTAFGEGRLPLWSDRIDGGSSPWANPQAQVLSPIKVLARLVPIENSLATAMLLTILVAFEGTWVAARLFGAARGAALLAACGFALGGGTVAWSIFPISSTVAWAPWLLAAVVRLVRKPKPRYLIAGSVITAVLVSSGNPETAATSGMLAVVCGLFLGRHRGGKVRGISAAAAAAVLGLGLSAPLVLPFAHTALRARRMDDSNVRPKPVRSVEWNSPATWAHGEMPRILLQPANPNALGKPFVDRPPTRVPWPVAGSVYCGISIFAGLALALSLGRRRILPLALFAAAVCLLSIKLVPIERALLGIPGIKVIVFNRGLPVVALCMCLIAAVGLTQFLRARSGRTSLLAVAGAAAVSILVKPSAAVAALWVLLFAALVVTRWSRRYGFMVLFLVVLSDLVPWSRGMLPVGRRELFYPPTAATTEMVRLTGRNGPWRVVASGTGFYPSMLAMYGLEDVRYHNPLVPQAYASVLEEVFGFHSQRRYFGNFQIKNHALLDFLNVRVVATKRGRGSAPGMKWRKSPGDRVHLPRNPGALNRVFVATSAEIVPRAGVVAAVAGLKDARRVVIAAEDVGAWRPPERPWKPKAVRIEHREQGSFELELSKHGEKLLATSLTVPDGWEATTRGDPLRTLTINGAFLGAVVPAGVEKVRLRFIPPGLRLGYLLCAVSIGILAFSAFFSRRIASSVNVAADRK